MAARKKGTDEPTDGQKRKVSGVCVLCGRKGLGIAFAIGKN
jgi:hypothetical protein